MFTKLYETIKKYIKKEYKFILTILIVFLLMTIRLPYYIDAPGGIINISDRIKIDSKQKLTGTLNLAYVSEMEATIPTYIISKLNKDWDLIDKKEIIQKNETLEEAKFRDQLSLKEAICNAEYIGLKEANVDFNTTNNKTYVTYIYENAKTDVKIGDQIIEVDGKKINTIKELQSLEKQEGKTIKIKVINNNKEYTRTAEYIKIDDKIVIGIGLGETFDIESKYKIDINYKARESGPSGGMMMALTIYSEVTETDLTNGKKIVGTGTIDSNGIVGEIGGVKYKLIGAVKNKADIFLVPNGENYEEAIKIKKEKGYNIKIIGVSSLKDAINELKTN